MLASTNELPLLPGGSLVKAEWFKSCTAADLPAAFEMIFQSWDTANIPNEFRGAVFILGRVSDPPLHALGCPLLSSDRRTALRNNVTKRDEA